MPLTPLTHEDYITANPAANTIEEWLNELYDTVNGNMTNWTVDRYQNVGVTEAVYFTPKATTEADDADLRIIFAGVDSGSPTPTMGANSSFSTGNLMVGMVVDGDVFNAWDDPDPFTSGSFSGYHVCGETFWTLDHFLIAESAGTILLCPQNNSGQSRGGAWVGAAFDAESTHPANSYDEDGRIYAVMTGGYDNTWSMYDIGYDTTPFTHSTSAQEPKATYLETDGTWDTMGLVGAIPNSNNSDMRQIDDSPWLLPIFAMDRTNPYHLLGRAREVYIGPKALTEDEVFDSDATAVARLLTFDSSTPIVSLALGY